jgi:hypothetical protein
MLSREKKRFMIETNFNTRKCGAKVTNGFRKARKTTKELIDALKEVLASLGEKG